MRNASNLFATLGLVLLLFAEGRSGHRRAAVRMDRDGFLLSSGGWAWGLSPEAWGREGALRPWDGLAPETRYERRPEGLEQSFLVQEKPPGDGPLVLDQVLRGGLQPLRVEGPDAVFGLGGSRLASYTGLKVLDAGGRVLPSRMLWTGSALRMEVEDAGARYPVLVDPLASTANWVAEISQAGATFGWITLPAGDVNADGYEDVIVGAPLYDNGEANEGRAWVFHGGSGGLSTAAAWVMESNQASAQFGFYAGGAGDVNGDGYSDVIVGAPYYDNDIADEGRAYVYHGGSGGLSTTAAWVKESDWTNSFFAGTVAGAGDVNGDGYSDAAVGARLYDNGENNEGRVFVFHGSPSGLVTASSFTHESNRSDEQFAGTQYGGRELASAGDVNGDGYSDLVVGAYGFSNGEGEEGRVFVFHGSMNGLAVAVVFEPNVASTQFGVSTTSAGDVNGDGYSDLLVGCPIWTNGEANEGRALVYHGASGGLNTAAAWASEPNQAGADYGWTTWHGDVNGDGFSDVIVGADGYSNGELYEGRAFVFHGASAGLSTTLAWTMESNQASAVMGYSMGMADVNGDGFSDVLVDAQGYDNGEVDEGRAFCFHSNQGTVTYTTYDLPGTKRMPPLLPAGNTRIEHTNTRVVRDSNGYWYFAWQPFADNNMTSLDLVLLSYTTTSTPTSSAAWSTVTLAAASGGNVIDQTAASDFSWAPALAMSTSDELHFAWAGQGGVVPWDQAYFWTKCTNLSALTDPASWASVKRIPPANYVLYGEVDEVDLALDSNDVVHALYVDSSTNESPRVKYTKYNTATEAFLSPKTIETVDRDQPRIDIDLDDNVYALFHSTGSTCHAYLLACTNAFTTSPANTSWMNLAQTNSIADTVTFTGINYYMDRFTAAGLSVSRDGMVHVVWRGGAGSSGSLNNLARNGRIKTGFEGGTVGATGAFRRSAVAAAFGSGKVYRPGIRYAGSSQDGVSSHVWFPSSTYRGTDGFWGSSSASSDLPQRRTHAVWMERKAPPNATSTLWFAADSARHRMVTSWTDRFNPGAGGWRPPTPVKQQRHPHFHWAFPNTSSDLSKVDGLMVALTSQSSVYVLDGYPATPRLFALDRATGVLSRSAAVFSNDPVGGLSMTASSIQSNIRLYLSGSTPDTNNESWVECWLHDGATLAKDPAWVNNPKLLSLSATGVMTAPIAITQSGVRYLYVLGSDEPDPALYKLYADNGNTVSGFPALPSTALGDLTREPTLRILNDQVFFPGGASQLYRRETDGSAEIASSAVVNAVKHLVQVRGQDNNRLFVSPEDQAVWMLTSALKTTDWTGGTSANLGALKTSGAYYTRTRNAVLVGVGNQLYRLNVSAGTIWANWPMATTGNIVSLPVEWRTYVYFGTDSGRLYAVNSTTNVARANWPVLLDTTVFTPSATSLAFDAVSGHVYFATNEGRVYKFVIE